MQDIHEYHDLESGGSQELVSSLIANPTVKPALKTTFLATWKVPLKLI